MQINVVLIFACHLMQDNDMRIGDNEDNERTRMRKKKRRTRIIIVIIIIIVHIISLFVCSIKVRLHWRLIYARRYLSPIDYKIDHLMIVLVLSSVDVAVLMNVFGSIDIRTDNRCFDDE
jgi:hypothetical protein